MLYFRTFYALYRLTGHGQSITVTGIGWLGNTIEKLYCQGFFSCLPSFAVSTSTAICSAL